MINGNVYFFLKKTKVINKNEKKERKTHTKK